MKTYIIHSSLKRGEYFFSTDHCQESHTEKYPKGEDFVPASCYLPMSVVPRASLPTGIITNKEELIKIFFFNQKEIPNPDPAFQPGDNEGSFYDENETRDPDYYNRDRSGRG